MSAWLAIALSLVRAAADAYVTVSAALSPPVIPFHRQAAFSVVVEAPAGLNVEIAPMAKKFGGLGISGVPTHEVTALKNGRKRITETYVLDPIFIGDYPIEPVEVTWGDGQKSTAPSPVLRVRDLTAEEAAAAMQFAANAGPTVLRSPLARYWKWWAGVGGLALLAGILAFWLWRRRKAPEAAPPIPAWEVAYGRLRELDSRHLPEAGQWEPFYVELSDILRHYIEMRFQLHAPERTTPEFLAEAAVSGVFSDAQQKMLAQFMLHCDRVKFARYQPVVPEMERSFAQVLQFVDETVPRAVPAQQEAAA